MDLILNCSTLSSTLPTIPMNTNVTNIESHSNYNSKGRAIYQLISSSISRSTFSITDVQAFLKQITASENMSWDVSTIVKLKPIKSSIIYASVILGLFLIFSIIFCVMSCGNFCKKTRINRNKGVQKRRCSRPCVYFVLILLLGLIIVGQMIFLSYQVNRARITLDNSIKEVNQEIYPKDVSIYLKHLLDQLKAMDEYTKDDSIVIKASRLILFNSFNQILEEKYFFDQIRQSANSTSWYIDQLGILINNSPPLMAAKDYFLRIQDANKNMIDDLKQPLQELCNYAEGKKEDVDEKVVEALHLIHEQMTKITDMIQEDLLSQMTPWENAMLMNKDLEETIRWYVQLVATILLVLIIVLGLVPIIVIVVIIIHLLCRRQNKNKYQPSSRTSKTDTLLKSSGKSPKRSSFVVLCCMRTIFTQIMIIFIVIILITGVFHCVDLFVQGACRTCHDDQPFLVSFFIDQVLGTNSSSLFVGELNVQDAFTQILKDCGNHIHFSDYFFQNHLSNSDDDISRAINQLNGDIYKTFSSSIQSIEIQSDLEEIEKFSTLFPFTETRDIVSNITYHLENIRMRFDDISATVPTLPNNTVYQTLSEFKDYVNRVLKYTIDACPLPLSTIYKADTSICHNFASSVNGLWLGVFLYIFFILLCLCICGLYIYT